MQPLQYLPQLPEPSGLSEAGTTRQAAPHKHGNLCAEGQSRGLRVGVVCFTVTLAAAIVLAKTGAPPVLRWLLAAPFFLAIVGVSQSLLQTCPFLALKSLRDPGEGIEPVADPRERAALRTRGQRLLLASAAVAIAAAGLFAELPL